MQCAPVNGRRCERSSAPSTTLSRHLAASAARLPYLPSEQCLRLHGSGARAHARLHRGGGPSRQSRVPCSRTASSTTWSLRHEQQHSETILQTLQIMTARALLAAAQSRAARHERAHVPAMVLVEGGPFEMGASCRLVRLRQRAPAHIARARVVLDRRAAGDERADVRVHRGRRLRPAASGGPTEGWKWRENEASTLPALLAA